MIDRGGQCRYVGTRLEPTRLAQEDLLRASDSKSPAPSFFLRVSLTLRDLDVTVVLFTIRLNRFKLVTVERYVGSFRLAVYTSSDIVLHFSIKVTLCRQNLLFDPVRDGYLGTKRHQGFSRFEKVDFHKFREQREWNEFMRA